MEETNKINLALVYKMGQVLLLSSTDSSSQGSGDQSEALLLGSSTAGLSWRITLSSLVCFFPMLWRGIYTAFDSDHKQLYFHL